MPTKVLMIVGNNGAEVGPVICLRPARVTGKTVNHGRK
jgi:hypothetical protein